MEPRCEEVARTRRTRTASSSRRFRRFAPALFSRRPVLSVALVCVAIAAAVAGIPTVSGFPQEVENPPKPPPPPTRLECLPPFECVELCRCRKDDVVESEDPLAIISIKSDHPALFVSEADAGAVRDCFKDTGFLQDGTEKIAGGLCKDAAAVCCREPLPPKEPMLPLSVVPDVVDLASDEKRQQPPSWKSCGVAPKAGPGYEIKFTAKAKNGAIPGVDFTEAKPWEFPWTAVILEKFTDKALPTGEGLQVFVGTGSVVHPSVVMTAGTKLLRFRPKTNKELTVRVGVWDLTSESVINSNVPEQEIFVRRILFHPDLVTGGQYQNNIALLFLEKPITALPNVAIICLPTPDQDPLTDFDQTCVATGFGTYEKGRTSIMKKAFLHPVEHELCSQVIRDTLRYPPFRLHESSMCASANNGLNDTCKGDGGGPLVCRHLATGAWTQLGITAWGVRCDGSVPGVYTDVRYFYDWIQDHLPT